ncbi:anamorsin homolog [Camellia sinensis]|uniref:anamorsin homolog n=1 Tax=Camellia sinensis TaxID=4442 RepID=UPI001035FDAE|nr:anamorsin homolog [Camellia sinensis]
MSSHQLSQKVKLLGNGLNNDTIVMQSSVLALTDLAVLPISAVLNAIKMIKNEGLEQIDPLIITQASLLSQLPVDLSSVDRLNFLVISCLGRSQKTSSLELKLLVAGFLDVQVFLCSQFYNLRAYSLLGIINEFQFSICNFCSPSMKDRFKLIRLLLLCLTKHGFEFVSFSQQIKARKPSWKIGSSFSLKSKPAKSLPKVQIDDDMDLIDEDSLLTEEDLKKPQLPPIGDCEVSSMRKACKNCTCGRAEEEEKVQKLGLTRDQLNNPQSACGSCGLGDAFRCGTCPYRGLPPFKLGDKVTLSGNFLAADI